MHTLLCATGQIALAWSLGLTLTTVLLDSQSGFLRDHPPRCWRLSAYTAAALAWLSLALHALVAPPWLVGAVVLPYALLAQAHARSWRRGDQAAGRRGWGRQAAIIGLIATLFISLNCGVDEAQSALVMAAFAGSAALLGGLTSLVLSDRVSRDGDQVDTPRSTREVPLLAVATGLGVTLLALLDVGIGHLMGRPGPMLLPLGGWAFCSLLLPLGLVSLQHHRQTASLWVLALGSAVVGQAVLQFTLIRG